MQQNQWDFPEGAGRRGGPVLRKALLSQIKFCQRSLLTTRGDADQGKSFLIGPTTGHDIDIASSGLSHMKPEISGGGIRESALLHVGRQSALKRFGSDPAFKHAQDSPPFDVGDAIKHIEHVVFPNRP